MDGAASVAPVTADLQVAVKEIDIRPFQPYVADKVKVTITDGRVSTRAVSNSASKSLLGCRRSTREKPTLGKFAAIEKINADDILKWDSLALQELSVGYNPLVRPRQEGRPRRLLRPVIIQPNGRLNLQEIVGHRSGEPGPAEARRSVEARAGGPPRRTPRPRRRRAPHRISRSRRSPCRAAASSSRIARSSRATPQT